MKKRLVKIGQAANILGTTPGTLFLNVGAVWKKIEIFMLHKIY
jgi:hypothetical protein